MGPSSIFYVKLYSNMFPYLLKEYGNGVKTASGSLQGRSRGGGEEGSTNFPAGKYG